MLTVIIETRDDEMRLARALAALVPAATDGFVRDVVVIDRGSTDSTLAVADAAGCLILRAEEGQDARRLAAEAARGDWLLLLDVGVTLPATWQAEAAGFIDRATAASASRGIATFRRGRLAHGWWGGWWGRARSLFAPVEATLVARSAYLASVSPSPASSAASSVSGVRRGAA
jgi:glycosyltransferase involved in cell wall biosynthesis